MRKLLILSMGVLAAGAAFAQGHEQRGEMFGRADTNGDGYVSRDEFLANRADHFGKRDRNGDGFIDKSDLSERAAGRPRATEALSALITKLDADGDGKVGKSEFVEGGARVFDLADTDKNNTLDKQELEAAKAKRRAAR